MDRKPKRNMPEREFIRWIRGHLRCDARNVPVGPGDDMALVRMRSKSLLVAIDTIAEGVDFNIEGATPRQIGRKALAVNLSDVAAMGGVPSWCLASVNLREGLGAAFEKSLASGLMAACQRYRCPLVGGDITGWKDGIVLTVAIGAEPAGKGAITRRGARPGDAVLVTGVLGGSILGKHLLFEPKLSEGKWLARRFPPTAMIDVSDGLGVDAAHIADESDVSIAIDAALVPVSRAARTLARSDGKSPLHHAVSDGEDFELLFCVPEGRADALMRAWPFRTPVSVIGGVRKGHGVVLRTTDGRKARIDSEGYQHF